MLCGAALGAASCTGKGNGNAVDSDSLNVDSLALTDEVVTIDSAGIISEAEAYFAEVYNNRPNDEQLYSPEFLDAIQGAEIQARKEGNEMGYFDMDLLTYSQDPGKYKSVSIESLSADTVVGNVKGSGFGSPLKVTIVRVNGKFMIDDINGEKAKAIAYTK